MTNLRGRSAPEPAPTSGLSAESGMAQVAKLESHDGASTNEDIEAAATGSAAALPRHCPECDGRYPADFRVCPRDATPLEDAPESDDPILGTTLAESYEIVRAIGEGGMGRVYEARHTRLHSKRYAVKLLHRELTGQPEVMTRFQREAEAASALVHPNVVGVYDVNHTPDGRPYIVAELLEGEEFGDYLDRIGKLPAPTAVFIVRKVCHALEAAHAHGIVHRDMKPENVFLAGDPLAPSIKVLDFGISKLVESNQELTKTGMVMGTPAYMAPEQARGDKIDARADIYAVGAILYRAVTGHKPFEGLDAMATLTAVLVEEPPRPCTLEPTLPAALELVIQRAMAKNPVDRYASMTDLDADLAPFDPGSMPADGMASRGSDTSRPNTIITASTAASVSSDPTAHTVFAGTTSAFATEALMSRTRNAKLARPSIVVLTIVALGWLSGGLIDLVAAAIRLSGDSRASLTTAEVSLTIIAALAAILTPAVLWIRYLARRVWKSSPRAIEVAQRLRQSLLFGVAAYGTATLLVHLLEVIVRRDANGIAWAGWSIVSFLASSSVATAVWFGPGLTRPRA